MPTSCSCSPDAHCPSTNVKLLSACLTAALLLLLPVLVGCILRQTFTRGCAPHSHALPHHKRAGSQRCGCALQIAAVDTLVYTVQRAVDIYLTLTLVQSSCERHQSIVGSCSNFFASSNSFASLLRCFLPSVQLARLGRPHPASPVAGRVFRWPAPRAHREFDTLRSCLPTAVDGPRRLPPRTLHLA